MYIYNYISNEEVRKASKKNSVNFTLEEQCAIIINSERTLKDKLSALRTLKGECSVNLVYQIEAWENYKRDVIKQASSLSSGCAFCLLVDGEVEKFFSDFSVAEKYIKEYVKKNTECEQLVLVSEAVLDKVTSATLEKDSRYNKLIYNGRGELLDAECKTQNHTYLTAVYGKRLDTIYVNFPNPYKEYDVVTCELEQAVVAPETEENKKTVQQLVAKFIGKKGYSERYIPVYYLTKTEEGYSAKIGALPLLSLEKTPKDEISAKSRFTLKQLRKLNK